MVPKTVYFEDACTIRQQCAHGLGSELADDGNMTGAVQANAIMVKRQVLRIRPLMRPLGLNKRRKFSRLETSIQLFSMQATGDREFGAVENRRTGRWQPAIGKKAN